MSDGKLTEVARYRVLFDDCDPMRIMYYGAYYRLFEIGWTELLRTLGHPPAIDPAQGARVSVIEVGCRYVRPARYDDELIIKVALTDHGDERFAIDYEIVGPAGELLATGRSVHAIVDAANCAQPLPTSLIDAAKSAPF